MGDDQGERIGRKAIERGLIKPDQLAYAREVQSSWRASGASLGLGQVFLQLRYLDEEQLASLVSGESPPWGLALQHAQTQPDMMVPTDFPRLPPPPAPPQEEGEPLITDSDVALVEAIQSAKASGRIKAPSLPPEPPPLLSAPSPSPSSLTPPDLTPAGDDFFARAAKAAEKKPALTGPAALTAMVSEDELARRLTGKTLGSFRLEELIGRGALGLVFRGIQEPIKREVAVKVLAEAFIQDEVALARFRREALSAGRLTHPHIVGVLDYDNEGDLHYLVMTYIDGETTRRLLERGGPLPPAKVARILMEMADALAAMDRADLIHRDIKAENIMIRKDGRSCLMDLGLAKPAHGQEVLTAVGYTVGTPSSMAPEQCRGHAATAAVDIYGLGATLFELLTGRAPYIGRNPVQVMQQHVKAPVPDPRERRPDAGPELSELIMAMMAKSPVERPSAERLLEQARELGGVKRYSVRPASAILPLPADSDSGARRTPSSIRRSRTTRRRKPGSRSGSKRLPRRLRRRSSSKALVAGVVIGLIITLLIALMIALLLP